MLSKICSIGLCVVMIASTLGVLGVLGGYESGSLSVGWFFGGIAICSAALALSIITYWAINVKKKNLRQSCNSSKAMRNKSN